MKRCGIMVSNSIQNYVLARRVELMDDRDEVTPKEVFVEDIRSEGQFSLHDLAVMYEGLSFLDIETEDDEILDWARNPLAADYSLTDCRGRIAPLLTGEAKHDLCALEYVYIGAVLNYINETAFYETNQRHLNYTDYDRLIVIKKIREYMKNKSL